MSGKGVIFDTSRTDKDRYLHKHSNRNQTFITECIKELKKTGQTICFEEWQLNEIATRFNGEITFKIVDGYFYITRK